MGAFDTLLRSFGQPMAEGFAGGIEEDRLRRANLADKLTAYRSLIPEQMKAYEQQKQIDARYNKPQMTFAPKGSPGYFDAQGFHPTPQPPEPPNALLGVLGRNFEVPQEKEVMPVQAGAPGYGAGEEATAGVVPPTRTVAGNDLLMRTLGLNPKEYETVPHISTKGELSVSFQKRPVGSTASPVIDASALPEPSPGMQWVQGVDAKGQPSWHQAAKIQEKQEPGMSEEQLRRDIETNPDPNKRALSKKILTDMQADKLSQAKAQGEARGAGYLASRMYPLYDAQTGRVNKYQGDVASRMTMEQPDRYFDTTDPMFRANSGELAQVQAQRGKIMSFMYAADRNLKLAELISDAVSRGDMPALNKYVLEAGESLQGKTGPVALNIGMQVAVAEMSKVTASPTGAGVVAREDREKWERLIRGAQTPEQVKVAVRTMHQDMISRKFGYDKSIWEIHQRLGAVSPEPTAPALTNPLTPQTSGGGSGKYKTMTNEQLLRELEK